MSYINVKKATPMFSGIITTCERYTEAESTSDGIIDTSKLDRIKEMQTVVSPSEQVKARGIKEGDLLALSFEKYKKSKNVKRNDFGIDEEYSKSFYYEMPVLLLDGREHLLVDISDIELKIDEFEWVKDDVNLIN